MRCMCLAPWRREPWLTEDMYTIKVKGNRNFILSGLWLSLWVPDWDSLSPSHYCPTFLLNNSHIQPAYQALTIEKGQMPVRNPHTYRTICVRITLPANSASSIELWLVRWYSGLWFVGRIVLSPDGGPVWEGDPGGPDGRRGQSWHLTRWCLRDIPWKPVVDQ